MIVLNGTHTTCIDVCKLPEISFFLHDASKMMCNFISMAKGEEYCFPIEFLMNKIGAMLSEYIQFEKFQYIMRVKESFSFNTFEMYVSVVETGKTVNEINIETVDCENILEQIKWTFSAQPKAGNHGS